MPYNRLLQLAIVLEEHADGFVVRIALKQDLLVFIQTRVNDRHHTVVGAERRQCTQFAIRTMLGNFPLRGVCLK